ncbi:hypothetical protein POTOM_041431 [Populus tomentosa]|uniref:Uncharacterized protein n=1 Tax=Populus tomentosa TaxID=118781 RepID=A0A8X7YW13_POPTO|nr:hypothetical protein POTOM_041431 [Populus tomentosa]
MCETNMKICSSVMKVLPGSSVPLNFILQHNQNVLDQFLSKIPGACNIEVGFPVSTSANCDAIHLDFLQWIEVEQ